MKTLTSLVATSVLLIGAASANAAYFNDDNSLKERANSRETVYEYTDTIPDYFSHNDENAARIETPNSTSNALNVIASFISHPDDN